MPAHEALQRWNHVKAHVKQRWDRLTDDDIERVRGNVDRLVDVLGSQYGYSHWRAEREVAIWRRKLIRQRA